MTDLKLSAVEKAYGKVKVLSDIDLEIKTGELVVFVGPSGCGKSTLLRMIAGLERITGGMLEIDGMRVNDMPPSQRGIAMVFQSYALYPHMSVYDNMAFSLRIAGQGKEAIDKAVRAAAEKLQLGSLLDRLPKELSGGQRQRVAIGRAIVRDPKVFLFDEPLSNLDAALRVATRLEIAQLKEAMPETTMIYVTHDQVEAMTLASRIVVLAGGGIAQVGAPLDLYERPNSTFVARFIGSPAMNLLSGEVVGTGKTTKIRTDQGGGIITAAILTQKGDEGMKVEIGIRPEDFVAAEGDDFAFEGRVGITEALGEVTLLYFDSKGSTGDDPVIAKLSGIHPSKRGEVLRLGAAPEKIHLFHKGISLLYRGEKVFLPNVAPH